MTEMESAQVEAHLRSIEDLVSDLGSVVTMTHQQFGPAGGHMVSAIPANPRSLAFSWIWTDEVVFEAGREGGRWELEPTAADLEFLGDLVAAVVAGRVVETFAASRSTVAFALSSGGIVRETGYGGGLVSLIPLPGWRRWGRRIQYEPYAAARR
ncbi:hypothetical protein [Kineosporia sp. NBRC 101731]|uniref:hypothetical protein n=1 Tax=Kineosporia sp. NBRC 101731 TaxID=3032199 RepID=UPI0024A1AF88|nr:hypothetical protein [Kineosporia sp. NBRC 101731]GLY33876.1 hypothetical protein Kisp02_72410 [Kineosporia sp. NBRC 101731]